MVVLFVPRHWRYHHCSPDLDAHSQVRSFGRSLLYKKMLLRRSKFTFSIKMQCLICTPIRAFERSSSSQNRRRAHFPSILTQHSRPTVQVSMAFLQFWFLNSLPRYLSYSNGLLHVFQLLDEPKALSFRTVYVLVCCRYLKDSNDRLLKFRD